MSDSKEMVLDEAAQASIDKVEQLELDKINKDNKLRAQKRAYYYKNKEHFADYFKKYYAEHKDKLRAYGNDYYETKYKTKQYITCECKNTVREDSYKKHLTTIRHAQGMEVLNRIAD